MRRISILFICLSCFLNIIGDNISNITDSIVQEGKYLYKLEMASWYGTDLFLEHYSKRDNIGGYFSYMSSDTARCVFFSRNDNPKVIGIISFDNTYTRNKANMDILERDFNPIESDLYTLRQKALQEVYSDTLFKNYENTNLNLIPLIYNGQKKVYILTGPQQSGVVIFGNDYLLTFDEKNKLTMKKQLHKNIIPLEYKKGENIEETTTMHSHLPETGDFITPTDICTLMLYEKFTNWKQHYVYSENYINIWDCENDEIFIMTHEAMENILKHSKEKKGN